MLKLQNNTTDESSHIELLENDNSSNIILKLKEKVFQLEVQLAQIQHFAYHDKMTGLPNRSLLSDRLREALKRATRNNTHVGLLLLDLNDFKKVNDAFGHHVGDKLLTLVSQRLLASIRAVDSAYRYGGDEFIVLLPEVDSERGAIEFMSKLESQLAKPYRINDRVIIVTASIGTAVSPVDGSTEYELIKRADDSMYISKNERKRPQ